MNFTRVIYSFDIADELDLDDIKKLLQDKAKVIVHTEKSDVKYESKPLDIFFESIYLEEIKKEGKVFMRFYDFGVVSVFIDIDFNGLDFDFMKRIRFQVSENNFLLDVAKKYLKKVSDIIAEAIEKDIYDFSHHRSWEDYVVFVLKSNSKILKTHEKELLSVLYEEPKGKSLANKIVYYYSEPIIVTWNASVLIGNDSFEDCLKVIEFANVSLLEHRYYDYVLDKNLDEINQLIETFKNERRKILLTGKLVKKVEEINSRIFSLSIEVLKNIDKVNNAFKLLGDLEITYLYRKLIEQLRINAWKESIEMRLDYLKDLSEFLSQDIKEARMDRMEWIMLILETLMILFWIWELFFS